MIEAIKELGEYIKQKENKSDVDVFFDKAKLKKTKKIICILLKKDTKHEYSYKRIITEDFGSDKNILYRGGSSAGVDILPSTLVTGDISKKFYNKIFNWFSKREEKEIVKIFSAIDNNKNKINQDLVREYNNLKSEEKYNVMLTIKIEDNFIEKHLGDIDIFKKIFIEDSKKKYYKLKTIGESRGNGICFLCNNSKNLYGFVLPAFGFSFATADKPGFTYYFIQKDYWKNSPICGNCALLLEIGKRFLDDYLNFPKDNQQSFLGYKYYVIPKFLFKSMYDELYKYVNYFKDKDYKDGILSKEDWLEKTFKEKGNFLRLIFVFYKFKGGGKYIDIVQYIENVLPSWLKRIDLVQEDVKNMSLFKEENVKKILGTKSVGGFVNSRIGKDKGLNANNWVFVFTRNFFPYAKYDKYFLTIISSIFSNKYVDKNFVISTFIRGIRNSIKNRNIYSFKILCLKSFMLFLFFKKLGLLLSEKVKGGEKMEKENSENSYEEKNNKKLEGEIKNFFEKYGFDTDIKRALFSLGMLVDYLLWAQRYERKEHFGKELDFGKEPFWSNLHSLILDEKKVKYLFVKTINKLRQYKRSYPSLEKLVGKYLAQSGDKWDLSKDEISYYFALGMVFGNTFKNN